MKIAIISDIHGNFFSFSKAFELIEAEKIDHIIFVGDVCGYYFDSTLIIDKLIAIKHLYAVRGNHDDMFLKFLKFKDLNSINSYTEKYGDSFHVFSTNARKEHVDFLESLPSIREFSIDNISFMVVHGGPHDYLNQQIFPDNDFTFLNKISAKVIIFGHTHYRIIKKIHNKLVINPGSLGQPRDGLVSSFVVFDTKNLEAKFVDVNYNYLDLYTIIMSMKKQPDYLTRVLLRPYSNKGI
jgi:putative phosphoesterase